MCEIAGRTAYKSEDRITEGSAKKFVEALMKLKHGAVLEHGTVYLKVSHTSPVADE
jgi:thymidylate synthase (FAD)